MLLKVRRRTHLQTSGASRTDASDIWAPKLVRIIGRVAGPGSGAQSTNEKEPEVANRTSETSPTGKVPTTASRRLSQATVSCRFAPVAWTPPPFVFYLPATSTNVTPSVRAVSITSAEAARLA